MSTTPYNPVKNPRIFLKRGWWRVSPYPKGTGAKLHLWQEAHVFVQRLNAIRNRPQRKCGHHTTTFDPLGWPTGESLEVCLTCGMSRTHWEQGESSWVLVLDIPTARRELEKDLEAL